MQTLITKDMLERMRLDVNNYYAVASIGASVVAKEDLRKYLSFESEFNMTHIRPKAYETHAIIKHYNNYIATYNLNTGVRDTIQKSNLITAGDHVVKLGKLSTGGEIMEMLEKLDAKGRLDEELPVILNLTYEDVAKDQYFIALEYVSDVTEGLIVMDKIDERKEVRRSCAIVSKAELDHYIERYPEITHRRVGM